MSDPEKPSFLDGLLAGFAEAMPEKEVDSVVKDFQIDLVEAELTPGQMVELGLWLVGQSVKASFTEGMSRDE